MSNLRNSVRLLGYLGHTPEVKQVGDNKKLARVSIATNTSYKNEKGEKIEETQWHNLVFWDKSAALAEKHLQKGAEICVEGKLTSRSYVDKDGIKRHVSEIVVSEFLFLSKK